MAVTGQGDGGVPAGVPGYLSYLPAAWLGVVMLLAVRRLVTALPLLSDYRLPDSVVFYVEASIGAALVTILWGLYVLGLAWNRSRRFPRHFTLWQAAQILWQLGREAYVQMTPDFVFSASSTAITVAQIAVGLYCLHLVRRNQPGRALYTNAETGRPPVLVSLIAALLGVIVGGVVGFGVGLGGGVVIADATEMSCFEGACGYFAFFLGLAGLLVGAIGGGILAVWLANRRSKPTA